MNQMLRSPLAKHIVICFATSLDRVILIGRNRFNKPVVPVASSQRLQSDYTSFCSSSSTPIVRATVAFPPSRCERDQATRGVANRSSISEWTSKSRRIRNNGLQMCLISDKPTIPSECIARDHSSINHTPSAINRQSVTAYGTQLIIAVGWTSVVSSSLDRTTLLQLEAVILGCKKSTMWTPESIRKYFDNAKRPSCGNSFMALGCDLIT